MGSALAKLAKQLISLKEACQYGRIGRTRLYELIDAGKIDAYKDGRKTWIDARSIDRYRAKLPRVDHREAS